MKIGFYPLLFIVLLILKLTGFIAWSWWLVSAPLWFPFIFLFVLVLTIPIFLKIEGDYWDRLEVLINQWTKELNKKK